MRLFPSRVVQTSVMLLAMALGFAALPAAQSGFSQKEKEKGNADVLGAVRVPPRGPESFVVSALFSSGNIAVAIPDDSSVTNSINVTNFPGAVYDVAVRLRLNHTYDNDLVITLTSPSGVGIPLAANLGGNGQNYGSGNNDCSGTPTIFDDEAPSLIDLAAPPFAGTFRPQRALSAIDETSVNGIWTLKIADTASTDSGTLGCWSLAIKRRIPPGSLADARATFNIFRPSAGTWFSRTLTDPGFTLALGQNGDIPFIGAFSPTTFSNQFGVFRPTTGEWVLYSQPTIVWGVNGDIPVPGDYNGDGLSDIGVWRPSIGVWFIRNVATANWGAPGDIPVPADYLGNNMTNFAVWRPSNAGWFINGLSPIVWGSPGDIPVPADYFGDERVEIAVFRPSEGVWYVRGWDGESRAFPFGVNGDIPVPADYDGDGKADIAVWRPSDGRWYIRDVAIVQYGVSGDIPANKRPTYPSYPF